MLGWHVEHGHPKSIKKENLHHPVVGDLGPTFRAMDLTCKTSL